MCVCTDRYVLGCTQSTYSHAGWANGCVDGKVGGSRTTVLRGDGGRLPHLLEPRPINTDPSGNLIVNKAEIQTNNTGSSSMGGRVGLEWCGMSSVALQGEQIDASRQI